MNQEYANKLFNYDYTTGELTWKVRKSSRFQIGERAGTWNHGYLRVCIDRKHYPVHRVIWLMVYGKFPENYIDHINRIRSDNRLSNLREATYPENAQNQSKRSNNTSGVTGVCFFKRENKWCARITFNHKTLILGLYSSFDDAVQARREAEEKYFKFKYREDE